MQEDSEYSQHIEDLLCTQMETLLPMECSSQNVRHNKCLIHQVADIPCHVIVLVR